MRGISEQAKTARYQRVLDVVKRLDWHAVAPVYRAAQLRAQKRLEAINQQDPDYRAFETIVGWLEDTCRKSLQRGRYIREFVGLLSEVFAERDTRKLGLEQKKDAYFQYIMNDVPLDDATMPKLAHPVSNSVFPLVDLTQTEITEPDGDLFFNAVRQGLGAVARNWDIARVEYGEPLRASLLGTSETRSTWDVHFIGGSSGSGKSILLDRIAFEARESGARVFTCLTAYVDPQSFFDRLNTILSTAAGRVLVLFDDAHKLEARGVSLDALIAMQPPLNGQRVTLVLAANWQLQHNSLPLSLPPDVRARKLTILPVLTQTEVGSLVEKVCWAERTGVISAVRCTVPEAERAALIKENRERLILFALLKLRYAKNVREALREEFVSIAQDAARHLYTRIAVMEAVGCPLPRSAMTSLLSGSMEAIGVLRTLIWQDGNRLHLRHPLLIQPTLDVVCAQFDLRSDILCDVLSGLNRKGREERRILLEYFQGEGLAQRLCRLFRYDRDLIINYLNSISDYHEEFKKSGLGSHFHAHLGTIEKDVLLRYDRASAEFENALQLDHENVYASKQLAWSLLRDGKLIGAEEHCRTAVKTFSDEPELISDCAYVMSWCSPAGFLEATELYRVLLKDFPEDEELSKRWARHQEASAIVHISNSASFADWQYKEMLAPSFIWRVRRNAVKQYNRSLFGRLSGALRDSEMNLSLLEEAGRASILASDNRLRGLVEAYAARHLYERWYRDQEEVDLDEVEKHFRKATDLSPEEPFAHCWYGTFLKEARNDYAGAAREYQAARDMARKSKIADIVEHPMILNNMALLHLDAVYTQKAPADIGLAQADKLLRVSISRMDETNSHFRWPIDTQARLHAMAKEFGVSLGGPIAAS